MRHRFGLGITIALAVVASSSFILQTVLSNGASPSEITLGRAADYSIVSGGTIVLGATLLFTDSPTASGANYPALLSGVQLGLLSAAGMAHVENGNPEASLVLADVATAFSFIQSLPGSDLPAAEMGGATYLPGVYDAPSSAALNIASPVVQIGRAHV